MLFVARRCGIKKMGDREKKYVHMLNATLCATGRAICCLLENYQEENGVRVPDVLVPFMGGITFLPFVRESKLAEKDNKANSGKEEKKAAKDTPKQPETKTEAVETEAAATANVTTTENDKAAKEAKDAKKAEKEAKKEAKKKEAKKVIGVIPDTIKPPPAYTSPAPVASTQNDF